MHMGKTMMAALPYQIDTGIADSGLRDRQTTTHLIGAFTMNTIKLLLASVLLSFAMLGTATANDTVNINTADAATLAQVLHNIGPAKAEAIVAWREENGPFKSMEQLAQVKGIGLSTIERNRERIVITTPAARRPANPPRTATASTGIPR